MSKDTASFSNLAEFVQAVYNAKVHKIIDPRLISSKISGQGETVPADGGYLVTEELLPVILSSMQAKSVLWDKALKLSTSKFGAKIPFIYESERKTGTTTALDAFWVGEGVAKTKDKATFKELSLKMHKLVITMAVTEELMMDSVLLNGFLDKFVPERMGWKVDEAILIGNGLTSMYGIMSADTNGVIGVATPNPIIESTILNYEKALAPAAEANAEWYMSKENYNDVLDINFAQENALTHDKGETYLLGHKINIMEQMKDLCHGIMLGDASQYLVVTKGDIVKDINISLLYLEDEQIFRWVLRINGKSYGQRYTLEDGTDVATFVIPDCAPAEESSSSSSGDSNSSTSSSSQSKSVSTSSSSFSSSSDTSSSTSFESRSSNSSSSKSLSSASSESTGGYSVSSASSGSSGSSGSSKSSGNYSESSSESSGGKSNSSNSSSISSHALQGCDEFYCGTQFTDSDLRGTYSATGEVHDGKPIYYNGTVYMWYDTVTDYWVISNDVGDPQNQWLSSIDTIQDCPDGDSWVDADGVITAGVCAQ